MKELGLLKFENIISIALYIITLGLFNGLIDYLDQRLTLEFPEFYLNKQSVYHDNSIQSFIDSAYKSGIITYISRFDHLHLNFCRVDTKEKYQPSQGRSISKDDPLLEKILEPEINHAIGNTSGSLDGLIVTRQLLQKLGYGEIPTHIKYQIEFNRGTVCQPVPLAAVVDKIPGVIDHRRLHFMCSEKFFQSVR